MDEDDYRQALAKLDSLEQHDTTSLSSRRLDEGMIPMVWLQTEDEVSVEVPVRVGLTRHGVQVLVTETIQTTALGGELFNFFGFSDKQSH